jgi:transcriptional regulator with XRE-family HTH domain
MARATTFGQRFDQALRRWRVGGVRERTDLDFAKEVGVTSGLVSQWKEREDAPPPGSALKAALALGVDPGWLSYGELSTAPAPEWWPAVARELASQPAPRARGHRAMTAEAEAAAKAAKKRRSAS